MIFSEFSQQTQKELLYGEAQTTREWLLQQRCKELESKVRALTDYGLVTTSGSIIGPELGLAYSQRNSELFLSRVSGEMSRPGGGYHFHVNGTGSEGARYVTYYMDSSTPAKSIDLSITMNEVARRLCDMVIKNYPYSAKDQDRI